jgi:hypothetical protein
VNTAQVESIGTDRSSERQADAFTQHTRAADEFENASKIPFDTARRTRSQSDEYDMSDGPEAHKHLLVLSPRTQLESGHNSEAIEGSSMHPAGLLMRLFKM